MFNPFRAPSNAGPWQPPSPWKAFVAWAVLCVSGLGLAFLLRQEAVSQLHKLRWTGPNVTAISFEPRDSARLTAMVEAVLSAGPVRLYMNNAPDHDILLQIVTGGDQGRHLLTDLGMKAGAVQAAGLPEQGELVVLSRLIGPRVKNDPFDLNTRIEPVMLVYPSGVGGAVEARAFIPEQFYPDFARIMF
jgi:hypothetical protein